MHIWGEGILIIMRFSSCPKQVLQGMKEGRKKDRRRGAGRPGGSMLCLNFGATEGLVGSVQCLNFGAAQAVHRYRHQ